MLSSVLDVYFTASILRKSYSKVKLYHQRWCHILWPKLILSEWLPRNVYSDLSNLCMSQLGLLNTSTLRWGNQINYGGVRNINSKTRAGYMNLGSVSSTSTDICQKRLISLVPLLAPLNQSSCMAVILLF